MPHPAKPYLRTPPALPRHLAKPANPTWSVSPNLAYTTPATTSTEHAIYCRALPRLPCTVPHQTVPNPTCVPHQTTPRQALPATPYLTLPRQARPYLPRHAVPYRVPCLVCRVSPDHAPPAMPYRDRTHCANHLPYHTLPRQTVPAPPVPPARAGPTGTELTCAKPDPTCRPHHTPAAPNRACRALPTSKPNPTCPTCTGPDLTCRTVPHLPCLTCLPHRLPCHACAPSLPCPAPPRLPCRDTPCHTKAVPRLTQPRLTCRASACLSPTCRGFTSSRFWHPVHARTPPSTSRFPRRGSQGR